MCDKITHFLLVAIFAVTPIGEISAQAFTTLHSFTQSEGSYVQAGVVISGNRLYGVADSGGDWGYGSVFALSKDGTGFTNLYSFNGTTDGAYPDGTLTLAGNVLYGTTYYGGSENKGTVFAIHTDGTDFTNLYSFAGPPGEGANPEAGLIISGSTLYGTTEKGGNSGYGTVFALNIDGTGFTNLYHFTNGIDGATPESLLLSNNTLYGITIGSPSGNATVFKVNTNGTGFTTLHSFSTGDLVATGSAPALTNNDGALPTSLTLSGNILYGTAYYGGSAGNGTVFAIHTDGTGFTNLHSFSATSGSSLTNSEGSHPISPAGLILLGNTLYGTTYWGGTSGNGTVFALQTDGTGFNTLHHFSAKDDSNFTNDDGANPYAGLAFSDGTLYGTAKWGGSAAYGTVFSVSLPVQPKLAITHSGSHVILTWPTNAVGFTLQSSTNLASPIVWTPVSPAPVLLNGQNTVTNSISGVRQFYRLSQ